VLNTRLAELREARIVESTEGAYALTKQGRALPETLAPLTDWARSRATGLE
jgi:DNA-binding HxlR family transcriptional regulator